MKRSYWSLALAGLMLSTSASANLRDDVDKNGAGDIFFRGGTAMAYWRMSGGSNPLADSYAGNAGPGYTVVAVDDFDGDRSADVLWTNGSHLKLWLNDGAGRYTPVSVASYGGGWVPFAAGDINGDGRADVFFRGATHVAFWLMNGPAVLSSSYAGDGGVGWRPVAIGNINGDAKAEVLWTNGTQFKMWVVKDTGNHGIGYQATNGPEFYAYVMDETYGGGWTPFAVGDVNGDGLTDILFKGGTHIAYWLLKAVEGPFFPGYAYESHYGGNGGDGFHVIGVSDYNNDGGTADLLWTNGSQIKIWASGYRCSPWDYGCSSTELSGDYEPWPITGTYSGGWEPVNMLITTD